MYHKVVEVSRPSDGHKFEVTQAGHVVAGILYDKETEEYILVEQWRAGVGAFINEAIAGKVDEGETAAEAFVRECMEETLLHPHKVVELGTFYISPGWTDERVTLFFGTDLQPVPSNDFLSDEQIIISRYKILPFVLDLKTQQCLDMMEDQGYYV